MPLAYTRLTFPVQKVKELTTDDLNIWRIKVCMDALNMMCVQAFRSPLPGSVQDNVVMFLLSNSVPVEWQGRVLKQGCACDGCC